MFNINILHIQQQFSFIFLFLIFFFITHFVIGLIMVSGGYEFPLWYHGFPAYFAYCLVVNYIDIHFSFVLVIFSLFAFINSHILFPYNNNYTILSFVLYYVLFYYIDAGTSSKRGSRCYSLRLLLVLLNII